MSGLKSIIRRVLGIRTALAFLLVIACLSILQLSASATSYYVATNGSDGGTGAIGSPWLTINHGMQTMAAGDTLYIRGGSYAERVDVVNKNGSSGAKYTVTNYPGETPIMDASNNVNVAVAMKFVTCSYWHIEGLTIRNYVGAGIWTAKECSNIEIFRNCMYNFDETSPTGSGTEAILIGVDNVGETSPSYITVRGNTINNVGLLYDTNRDHGIYAGYGANNLLIDSNRIYQCSGAGIQFYGAPGVSNSVVCNNIIYWNETWGMVMWNNGSGNYILNNTFWYNPIDVDISAASGAYFKNNIFGSNTASYPIYLRDTTSNSNTFDYNVYWIGSGKSAVNRQGTLKSFAQWQGYSQEAHGRSGNPSFKDTANSNFRVAGTSNCLGTGVDATVTYDYGGTAREVSSPDVGAYDYNYSFDQFNGVSQNTYTNSAGSWSLSGSPNYYYQQTAYAGTGKTSVFYDFLAMADGVPTSWGSNKSWTNYILEADVKMTGSGPYYDVGLVSRVNSNATSYYVAILYTSQVDLWKNVNGTWTQLGTYPGTYTTNTYYHLALACNGTTIAVSVNGSGKISVTDAALSSGYPGMYTDYCGNFDNFKVAPY